MRRIDLVHTRLRTEERLILDALRKRGCAVELHRDDALVLTLDRQRWTDGEIVLMRSMSFTRARYLAAIMERKGSHVVNSSRAIAVCGDKVQTTLALVDHDVPVPWAFAGFEERACISRIEQSGYPVVTKPVVGSWGRMVARIDTRSAAEGILSTRFALGRAQDHVCLVQQYIDKPGYDLRVYVVGAAAIGGIRRRSEHWVTNTAAGAAPERYEVPASHAALAERAAAAVGGEIVAVDLLETRGGDIFVNEINHCVEFARSIDVTGIPLPEHIADHVLGVHR